MAQSFKGFQYCLQVPSDMDDMIIGVDSSGILAFARAWRTISPSVESQRQRMLNSPSRREQ